MDEKGDHFLGNVLKLVTGSVFAQGLTVAVLPIVARLYAPEALGVSALFLSLASLVGVLACLRYEFAIMLPETHAEAANLLGVCLGCILLVGMVATLLVPALKAPVTTVLNAPQLGRYLWLLPAAIVVNGLFLALNYWNSRTKCFGRLSIARVTSSTVSNTARVGFGLAGFASGGMLIVAALLGQLTTTVVLCGQIVRDDWALFRCSIRWRGMWAGIKRYRKFPLISSWSALLNAASRQLPAWILAFYFSPVIVGFFALGRLVLSIPMNFIGTSIGQVFYQRASEMHAGERNPGPVVNEVLQRLISVGMFPLLVLVLVGRDAFVVVFGPRWAEAGVFVQILGLVIFFQFISSPLMTLFNVYERQGTHLFLDGLLFGGRTLGLVVGGVAGDVRLGLALFAVAGMLYYVLFYIWMHANGIVRIHDILACLAKAAFTCVPFFGLVALIKLGLNMSPLWVTLGTGLCCLPYYGLVVSRDEMLQGPFRMMLQKAGMIR